MTTDQVPTRDDVSMSAFERAYAADVGESVETLNKRGIFRWHGRCYVSESINTRYRGWMLSKSANAAEIARLQAQVAELQALSVTHIMIDVVPGEDGMGEEIFATSVSDVERLLSDLGERSAEAETLQAQVDALAEALRDALPYINADVNEPNGPVARVCSALAAVGR